MVLVQGDSPPESLRYGDGKVPSVTQVIRHVGCSPSLDHIDPDVLMEKAAIGTEVHDAIDAYFSDPMYAYSEFENGRSYRYMDAFKKFKTDYVLDAALTEAKLTHSPQVGGTLDFYGTAFKRYEEQYPREVLIDWKTRAAGAAVYDQLQLTGYLYLLKKCTEFTDANPALWLVTLKEDGNYAITTFEPDFPTWFGVLAVWHWRNRNGLL